jgi:hypothetical protein
MKRIILRCLFATICVIFWASTLYAAPAPEGFVGVPWGATRAQVKQIMSERGWIRCTDSSPNQEVFKGAFDGMACDLHFVMAGNSFVEGYADPLARLPIRHLGATQNAYESTVKRLTEKYGPPQKAGDFDAYASTWGPASTWEFSDGITADKYRIRVIINTEGTWFADVNGKHTYFSVVYEAISLRDRLKNRDI